MLSKYTKGIKKKAGAFLKNNFKKKPAEISTGKRVSAPSEKKIKRLRMRLLEYGFEERALSELRSLALSDCDDDGAGKLAAIELARWYANKGDREGAFNCLEFIRVIRKNETDPDLLRKTAVMEAECYCSAGDIGKAKLVLEGALKSGHHADLCLARANTEEVFPEKIHWINKALAYHGLPEISFDKRVGVSVASLFDRLAEARLKNAVKPDISGAPSVSVILPVYNGAGNIRMALSSLLKQTWPALEIIVADDGSTDETAAVVEGFIRDYPYIKLLECGKNRGTFTALNMGLKVASGEFVTTHGADSWSHPDKIALQAKHLIDNPAVMANTSQVARCYDDLTFYRRGRFGTYIIKSQGSLLFHRIPVTEALGYWDSVRFSADAEFMRRLRRVFGKEALVHLDTGPLAFSLQSADSLTGHKYFGAEGFYKGARKEYYESQKFFYKTTDNLYYDFPQNSRPFPVPEPMWPVREVKKSESRAFDVILASDFRLDIDTALPNIELIKLIKRKGFRLGLVQMSRYDINPEKQVNRLLRHEIDGESVQMLVYGEKVKGKLLIVRHPAVLEDCQRFIPDVDAEKVKVITDRTPLTSYSGSAGLIKNNYKLNQCAGNLQKYFGKTGIWQPVNPLIRKKLTVHHTEELKGITIADADWVDTINADEWRRSGRPHNSKRIIGRYAKNDKLQWPDNRKDLLAVYPGDDDYYEVHFLGSDKVPEKVLKRIPRNWVFTKLNKIPLKDFLASLDLYVYYPYPGATYICDYLIIAAMAVGVPVVLPPEYRDIYGDAVLYVEAEDVSGLIDDILSDEDKYNAQVEKGWRLVKDFSDCTNHKPLLL